MFNRGPKGATRILQRAVGVPDDGEVGPQTRSAVASINAEQLLQRLRSAREQYERAVVRRNESSKFWRGLVNRWDNALATARKFSAGRTHPRTKSPLHPTATAAAGWIGALIAAMLAWFAKPKLTAAPKSGPQKLAVPHVTRAEADRSWSAVAGAGD